MGLFGSKKPKTPSETLSCSETVGGATKSCPEQLPCPPDFSIKAPCRIVKVNGGKIELTIEEKDGFRTGSYLWTTNSKKIKLVNVTSPNVTVEGLAEPSAKRDAETIKVTRSVSGCPDATKTAVVTVADVVFSAADNQRYGYDDYDTANDHTDDHIIIKRSDHTFIKVEIKGGAIGTDFNFLCDKSNVCVPVQPSAASSFNLKLDAGSVDNNNTALHAKLKCPDKASFAKIEVHVKKERIVNVVVAKVFDSKKAGTNLRFKNENYANFTSDANAKLKEAAVKFNITNYNSDNSALDVRYDLDGNGALTYDIANGGGAALNKIKSAMSKTGKKTRIAIVKSMKSLYYLNKDASKDETTIELTTSSIFYKVDDSFSIGKGANKETVTVASKAGKVITLKSKLSKDHVKGESMEFPAAGWSSDPILIIEGSATVNTLKWTILHEVGHNPLRLKDVDDTTNVMHYSQGNTDNRLRYCPRKKRYESGTENQWETISR